MDIEMQSVDIDKSTATTCYQPDENLTRSERFKSFFLGRFKVTSISMTVLLVWLLIETLLCVIVLNSMTENYIENFIKYICDSRKCPTLLIDFLYMRILVSSVSIVGILVGYGSLASIWVVMNALGLSPLFPVVFSCFYKYETLNGTWDDASIVWKIVRFICNCIF